MSVEKAPWIVRELAYGVYPIYPMGIFRSIRKNPSHASKDTKDGYPYCLPWFHNCAGTSVCFLSTEKKGPQALGRSKGWLTTKIHAFTVSIKEILSFILTPGNTSDTPIGNTMIDCLLPEERGVEKLLADRAYDCNETRRLLQERGIEAVIPSKKNRIEPIEHDRQTYKSRNEIERFWRFLKNFRRVFSRYEKLDVNYAGFVLLWSIVILLREMF
jgi:transposase